jgi:hypothetical protein
VLGSLLLAGQILDNETGEPKILVIFSDMRHHTRGLDLESPSKIAAWPRSRISQEIFLADLKGVQVYALGIDGAGKDFAYWRELQQFWVAYFHEAEAQVAAYSVLREQSFPWAQ